ncbi:hypothetical protein [Micromonospora sp. NPDC005806]|uniref:hypothetical protein n=1 Tax=Micromonospora sp. NPDC005806 TaxID=3364234 RepID=UPI00368FECAF
MTACELERAFYRAALSVRCTDAITGVVVADELVVTAGPAADPDVRLTATSSPLSGLQGFGELPSLRTYQRAPGPAPAPTTYAIGVVDLRRRYLPVVLEVPVPVAAPVEVPLHSSVSRLPPSGWAVVRGEVHDQTSGDPLAWPVVSVTAGPDTYDVVGDGLGRFLLIAPYPEALPPLSGSPPAGPGLSAMTWPLTIAVRSEPGALTGGDPPELGSILGQAPVAGPPATDELAFGAPTVLILLVQPS